MRPPPKQDSADQSVSVYNQQRRVAVKKQILSEAITKESH
jgi:hypothetical protein